MLLLAISCGLLLASCDPTSSSSLPDGTSNTSTESSSESHIYDGYTITPLNEATSIALEAGESGTVEKYYVYGVIESIDNTKYGNLTIKDDTGSLYIYGLYSEDGSTRYDAMSVKPQVGDEVVLYGSLMNFNGKAEMKDAWLMEHKEEEVPAPTYEKYSIKEARALEDGEGVILEGYVAAIRLGGGYSPAGFILVDEQSSIYVFTSDAANVKVGNKVTIQGVKDYWILEDEVSSAEKYDYKGANQIGDATVTKNDNVIHELPMDWVEEISVKDLLATPVTEDITSLVYKVNAQINRVEGTGFINYFIDDFDGTGSYIYTNNNGNDLEDDLLAYDGKLCTLYVTPLNAKCDTSGTLYRFMLVDILDDAYTMPDKEIPEFVYSHYVADQFDEVYASDPALELVTSVDNDVLNFKGATISYSSSDNTIFSIKEEEGKTILHWEEKTGEVTLTIKVTYKEYEVSKTMKIKGQSPDDIKTQTIAEVIAGDYGETYTVRGIAAGSYPHSNNKGFMLVDETGVLAIITTDTVMASLSQGNEVILRGEKYAFGEEGETKGTICLRNAELVHNLYGEHEYSTASLKTATVEELYNLPITEDHSFELYETTAVIKFDRQPYYVNIGIESEDGESSIRLYTNNGEANYGWLEPLAGKPVTLHLVPINWNTKNYYTFACIMASDGTTTLYNETTFGR